MNPLQTFSEWPTNRAFVVSLVLVGIYYVTGYNSGKALVESTSAARQKITQLGVEMKQVDKDLAELAALKAAQDKDSEKLNYLMSYIPEKFSKVDLMRTVSNEAKAVGTNILRISDNKSQASSGGQFYDEIAVEIELTGSFSQLLLFLSNLTRLDRIVSLDGLTMKSVGGDALSLVTSVKGYRYRVAAVVPVPTKANPRARRGKGR